MFCGQTDDSFTKFDDLLPIMKTICAKLEDARRFLLRVCILSFVTETAVEPTHDEPPPDPAGRRKRVRVRVRENPRRRRGLGRRI